MTFGVGHVWIRSRHDAPAECLRCGARVHWPLARQDCNAPYTKLLGKRTKPNALTVRELYDDLRKYG